MGTCCTKPEDDEPEFRVINILYETSAPRHDQTTYDDIEYLSDTHPLMGTRARQHR